MVFWSINIVQMRLHANKFSYLNNYFLIHTTLKIIHSNVVTYQENSKPNYLPYFYRCCCKPCSGVKWTGYSLFFAFLYFVLALYTLSSEQLAVTTFECFSYLL